MIEMYESGVDLYVYAAKQFNPNYNMDDPKIYNYTRGLFKMILLGLLYGIGVQKLMEMTNLSREECQRAQKVLLDTYPKLKEFIHQKSQYALDNKGVIDTVLGDYIRSKESKDKIARHGINACIQNFTSVILVEGFQNIINESDRLGKGIQPIIFVHDSATLYFKVQDFWHINNFYVKHFTDYLYDICGVRYLFKTLVGTNYWDVAGLTHLDEETSELKGTATSILNILDKMDLNNVKYKLDVDRNTLIKDWRTARQLLLEYPYDPHMGEDKSYYKVKITKC